MAERVAIVVAVASCALILWAYFWLINRGGEP